MELRRLSTAELLNHLESHAPALRHLVGEERNAVARMARRLVERDVAPRFVLAAVNSTVEVLRASPLPLRADNPPPEAVVFPASDARRASAVRMASNTRDAIREARAARRSNEVRHMRGVLRDIDQGRLREDLGEEGARLCEELNQTLAGLDPRVRRGRPRSQRVAV